MYSDPLNVAMRMRSLFSSVINRVPFAFIDIPFGCQNVAVVPTPFAPPILLPATVDTRLPAFPGFSSLRMRWFAKSAINMFPNESIASALGLLNLADYAAPSTALPAADPATVETQKVDVGLSYTIMRMRLLSVIKYTRS